MQLDFNAVAQVRTEGLRKVSTRQSIELATEYIIEHFSEEITIDDLALAARTSKFNLCRIFSRTYGITPIKLCGNLECDLRRPTFRLLLIWI